MENEFLLNQFLTYQYLFKMALEYLKPVAHQTAGDWFGHC